MRIGERDFGPDWRGEVSLDALREDLEIFLLSGDDIAVEYLLDLLGFQGRYSLDGGCTMAE